MTARSARLARGWIVGTFATAIAAMSHSVAGGGTPSPLALALGVVFGGMLGTFALTARPSLWRLSVAVGLTQVAFHTGFALLGTAASGAGSGTDAGVGHAHDVAFSAVAVGHPHTESPAMWVAHAIAGLLTLGLLRGAERALWILLSRLVGLVVAPFRARRTAPVEVTAPTAPAPLPHPVRLLGRMLTSTASRRGPPLLSAF